MKPFLKTKQLILQLISILILRSGLDLLSKFRQDTDIADVENHSWVA